jgi:hypothetical protein
MFRNGPFEPLYNFQTGFGLKRAQGSKELADGLFLSPTICEKPHWLGLPQTTCVAQFKCDQIERNFANWEKIAPNLSK